MGLGEQLRSLEGSLGDCASAQVLSVTLRSPVSLGGLGGLPMAGGPGGAAVLTRGLAPQGAWGGCWYPGSFGDVSGAWGA